MMNNAEKCSQYLKSHSEANRIMQMIRDKYCTLGRVGGTINLVDANNAERLFLRGILKRDFDAPIVKFSVKEFVDAFDDTRFGCIELSELLSHYFNQKIFSKVVVQKERQQLQTNYFKKQINAYPNLQNWLQSALTKKQFGYHLLLRRYRQAANKLTIELNHLATIADLITTQNNNLSLPILAAIVTKDPHALDSNKPLFKFLINYLSYLYQLAEPKNAMQVKAVLSFAGLSVNQVTSSVLTYQLSAFDKANQSLNWETFGQRNEPLSLLGANLVAVSKLRAVHSENVYIVENPALFHYLINRQPTLSLVCLSGQVDTVGHALLLLLKASKQPCFYHGDFDPEGLVIAAKLIEKYNNINIFAYQPELYQLAKSENELTTKRLTQLTQVKNLELQQIAQQMTKDKRAGYQEYIADQLLDIILKMEQR